MAISNVENPTVPYRSALGQFQAASAQSTVEKSNDGDGGSSSSTPSTSVTLSDGSVSEVSVYSGNLKMVPMSVVTAPQLFVQGDIDGDNLLSRDEFATQLKLVGVNDVEAAQLFDEFSHSKSDALSLDDYVQGIIAANKQGNDVFQRLFSVYTSGKEGGLDQDAFPAFVAAGASLAAQYWRDHPGILPRS